MRGPELNATAAALLGFLHEGAMTGWELAATARTRIGDFWSVTQSQVYRELAAMEREGLIEPGERGVRDRQPYLLTDAGHAAFAEWAATPPDLESIRFPLLLKLSFGRHVPRATLAATIAEHRRAHRERLEGYEAASVHLARLDPFQRATLSFGLAYERAVATWFDELAATFEERDGSTE